MSIYFSLTKEQLRAFGRLKKAHADCLKASIKFVNLYGTLTAFNSSELESFEERESVASAAGQYCHGSCSIDLPARHYWRTDCVVDPAAELNLRCNEFADDEGTHILVVTPEYEQEIER